MNPGVGICIATETFHPVIGGGETQARLLAEGVVSRGIPVRILTRRSDAALPAMDSVGAVTVHGLPPSGPGPLRKWGLIVSVFPALFRLRAQFHLVLVSGFRIMGAPAVAFCRIFGKACVLKADSRGEMSGEFFEAGLARVGLRRSSPLFRAFLAARNALLRRADAFVAVSDEAAAEFQACGVPSSRIRVIPNSTDTDTFRPAADEEKREIRQRLGIPPAARVAIYAGRLVSYKGLPLLLRVWHDMQRDRRDLLLLIVGTGGLDTHNCETALRAFVDEHSLGSSVRFTGPVENVADYLRAADVFALPTENDAFPCALVEAMACGLAVVSTPVGAIPAIVTDGADGLLVPPFSEVPLRRALCTLLGDAALRARLGAAASRTARQRFSSDAVTAAYLQVFEGLARGHAIARVHQGKHGEPAA